MKTEREREVYSILISCFSLFAPFFWLLCIFLSWVKTKKKRSGEREKKKKKKKQKEE